MNLSTSLCLRLAWISFISIQLGWGQFFDPEGAHVFLYYPQVMDGGSADRWQTSWVFTNPHATLPANVVLSIVSNTGTQLTLDFEMGRRNQIAVEVPPKGTRTVRTVGNASTVSDGWAFAVSSLPLQSIVKLRRQRGGNPQAQTIEPPVIPTTIFRVSGTSSTSLNLVNIQDFPIDITLAVLSEDGQEKGNRAVTIDSLSRSTVEVASLPGAGGSDFSGSILASADSSNIKFLGWAVHSDGDSFSGVPGGHQRSPVYHDDRAWLAFSKIFGAGVQLAAEMSALRTTLLPVPQFQIVSEYRGQYMNAFGGAEGIIITRGLLQLISDSESEVAFVVGHEMGHVLQRRMGSLLFDRNAEIDADFWGFILGLLAGYDPYAAAGALAKLAMATGQAGLIQQFENQISGEAHQSFNTRLQVLMSSVQSACAQISDVCTLYKSIFHPDLGPSAPLGTIKDDMRTANLRSLLRNWSSR